MMSSKMERKFVASSVVWNLIATKLSLNQSETDVSEDFFTPT